MIETRRLKNFIFIHTILSFVLSRKSCDLRLNDITAKYVNVRSTYQQNICARAIHKIFLATFNQFKVNYV